MASAPVVAVTHGGVIRALLARARGLALTDAFSIEAPPGSVHRLPHACPDRRGFVASATPNRAECARVTQSLADVVFTPAPADLPKRARTLMIQGTASDVGKSMVVAALCRAYTRRGLIVLPLQGAEHEQQRRGGE